MTPGFAPVVGFGPGAPGFAPLTGFDPSFGFGFDFNGAGLLILAPFDLILFNISFGFLSDFALINKTPSFSSPFPGLYNKSPLILLYTSLISVSPVDFVIFGSLGLSLFAPNVIHNNN